MSPDGEWVIIRAPGTTKDAVLATLAVPIHGGVPRDHLLHMLSRRGLQTGSSSMSGATGALPRPPRERRSRFPCRLASRCRICPLRESASPMGPLDCQAP